MAQVLDQAELSPCVQVSKKTTKRLSSVSEATADDVFGDENMGIKRPTVANRGNRRRLRFGLYNTLCIGL